VKHQRTVARGYSVIALFTSATCVNACGTSVTAGLEERLVTSVLVAKVTVVIWILLSLYRAAHCGDAPLVRLHRPLLHASDMSPTRKATRHRNVDTARPR